MRTNPGWLKRGFDRVSVQDAFSQCFVIRRFQRPRGATEQLATAKGQVAAHDVVVRILWKPRQVSG